jgi:acetoin utilization deacetylase AcuC-like enzyme
MDTAKTGVVFDQRMLLHASVRGHPESPARLMSVIDLIERSGLRARQDLEVLEHLEPM